MGYYDDPDASPDSDQAPAETREERVARLRADRRPGPKLTASTKQGERR